MNIFKKRYVIAYFDSVGGIDFYHGNDINGVPQWGCYADALRMNAAGAYLRLKSLGTHAGHVRVLPFAEAVEAIFSQPFYSDVCENCDDPDYITEFMLTEEEL